MVSKIIIIMLAMMSLVFADTKSEVERLFQTASSGEIRFTKLVQPAKDSLAAMKDSAAKYLVSKLTTTDAREAQTLTEIYRGIGKAGTPYLIAALDTDNKYQLRTTSRCLAEVKDSIAVDALLKAATNSDYTVRAEALAAVGKSGGGTSTATRLEPFFNDSIFSVRKSCVYGLGHLRSPASLDLLIRALADPHFGVRLTAYDALVSYDSLAREKVAVLLDTVKVAPVTGLAIRLAGQLRIHQVEPKLASYLADSNPLLRGWAVWSWGRLRGRDAAVQLDELQKSESDLFVKSLLIETRAYIDTLTSHE
ncbi:MAG: HEAT repeat domain-containing protein [candidate division Zixibacteria bacterium]|nr:HEAT repeat domain-containing protein [candidate division Zixibacteria bacterium]